MKLLLLKDNPNIKTIFKSYKPKNGKSESDLKRGTWDYKNMMSGTSYLVCYFLGQGSTKTFLPKTLHWETHHSLNAQKERQD